MTEKPWRARYERAVAWGKQQRPYRTVDRFSDVGGNIVSAGMAYQALFATFAALWVGFGVFGIVLRSRPSLQEATVEYINTFVPGLIGDATSQGAVDLAMLLSARTIDWTSGIAALALLWVAVSWFTGTRRAVRLIFRVPRAYSTAVRMKLRDAGLATGFGVAIILSAILSFIGTQVLHGLFVRFGIAEPNWLLAGVTNVSALVAMVVFDTLVLAAIVRVLAGIRVDRVNLFTGALMGAVALGIIKVLGSLLLGGASNNPLLASFAVFIGMLIWFNLIARVVLLTAAWIATGVSREEHQEQVLQSQPARVEDSGWL
jgi:membrane protein